MIWNLPNQPVPDSNTHAHADATSEQRRAVRKYKNINAKEVKAVARFHTKKQKKVAVTQLKSPTTRSVINRLAHRTYSTMMQ